MTFLYRAAARLAARALLALALLTPGLAAQGPPMLRDSALASDPIQLLLDRAAELRLTDAQSARLRTIQVELHGRNDPLVAQLVTMRHGLRGSGRIRHRDMPPEQRQEFQAAVQRARPLMQSIARNNREAMLRVAAVLTPAQKQQVRGWIQHQPGTPPGRIPHGAGMGRGRGQGSGAGPGGRAMMGS